MFGESHLLVGANSEDETGAMCSSLLVHESRMTKATWVVGAAATREVDGKETGRRAHLAVCVARLQLKQLRYHLHLFIEAEAGGAVARREDATGPLAGKIGVIWV
jgi:hypothetical protein